MSDLWQDNSIQFPRLIAELEACGAFTPQVLRDLAESMDLSQTELSELVTRAQAVWESKKQQHCPPVHGSDDYVKCSGCGNWIDPDVCHCGDAMDQHHTGSGHSPVPAGCDCGRVKTS